MALPDWLPNRGIETTWFNGGAYVHPFGKGERGRIEIYRHEDDGQVEIRVRDIQEMRVFHMEQYLVGVLKAVEIARDFDAKSKAERKRIYGDSWYERRMKERESENPPPGP